MYKKFLTLLSVGAVLCSCGKTNDLTSDAPESSSETSQITTLTALATEPEITTTSTSTETQPKTDLSTDAETASKTVAITTITTSSETDSEEETEPETLPKDYQMSDDELLYIAQQLYNSSCEMYWNFHVGCPYNLDYNYFTENQYGWQYYLIIDEGINSLSDVERDYHTIFSDTYPNDLNEIFIENDGRVYALAGGRGADIYYNHSEVNQIISKTDNEIIFSVEVFYNGDDYTGTEPYTVQQDFSIVIDNIGNWFTGLFTLPY